MFVHKSVRMCSVSCGFIKNKIKVNPDQRARPDYNWRKHITVKKNHETYVGHLVVGFGSGDTKHRS